MSHPAPRYAQHERRRPQSDFDPYSYYTIHNSVLPDDQLASGILQDVKGEVHMSHNVSSGNWQLYYQQGRYFVRNYDYGPTWQLGLDGNSRWVPRLLPRSGSLGQQWTLTRQEGGAWVFTNGLLGDNVFYSLAVANTQPGMQPSREGSIWELMINPSAGEPQGSLSFVDVDDFELSTQTSTSFSSSTSTMATASSGTVTSGPAPTSDTTISTDPSPANIRPLGPGVIAGIAIGGAFLIACVLVGFYVWRQRAKQMKQPRKPRRLVVPNELESPMGPSEMDTPIVELHGHLPAQYFNGLCKEDNAYRVELH